MNTCQQMPFSFSLHLSYNILNPFGCLTFLILSVFILHSSAYPYSFLISSHLSDCDTPWFFPHLQVALFVSFVHAIPHYRINFFDTYIFTIILSCSKTFYNFPLHRKLLQLFSLALKDPLIWVFSHFPTYACLLRRHVSPQPLPIEWSTLEMLSLQLRELFPVSYSCR